MYLSLLFLLYNEKPPACNPCRAVRRKKCPFGGRYRQILPALPGFYTATLPCAKGLPKCYTGLVSPLRAVPGGSVGGVELGSREPIFDIVVSAAKKSTFSRLSQNETAKECYQLGFFKPENADAALAALEMMDFEGIEKVRQRVRQNGTLAQQLARMQQQMAQMAAVIAQQGTGPDEPARSAGGASAQKDGQAVKLAGLGNALPVAAAARAMDIH